MDTKPDVFYSYNEAFTNFNSSLQGTKNITSNLAPTGFSFQNKIKVSKRYDVKAFRHFPNLNMTRNAFTEVITDYKVKEYNYKLQELLEEFQARFDD